MLGSEGRGADRHERRRRRRKRSTAGRKSVGAQILSFRDLVTV